MNMDEDRSNTSVELERISSDGLEGYSNSAFSIFEKNTI